MMLSFLYRFLVIVYLIFLGGTNYSDKYSFWFILFVGAVIFGGFSAFVDWFFEPITNHLKGE